MSASSQEPPSKMLINTHMWVSPFCSLIAPAQRFAWLLQTQCDCAMQVLDECHCIKDSKVPAHCTAPLHA